MKLGLICGMQVEARVLGKLRDHSNLVLGVSAAKPDQATDLAKQMITAGVDALVSWGIAGALSEGAPSGMLLVPASVVDVDGVRLPLSGLRPRNQVDNILVAGSDTVLTTPEAKAAMFARTGAIAVDMETHRIARVAARNETPCIAIRAISDPADRALPPGTENALDDAGRARILPVLAGLLRHPQRLAALLNAKRDLDCALQTLGALGVGLIEELLDH